MRLAPLPDEQWDERTRAALAGFLPRKLRDARGAGNALATLVRHPDLAEAFLGFNVHLLVRSTLPPRLRELAILRVARRCGCAYEWVHHVKIAARAGLSEAEVEAAGRGEVAGRGKAAGELDRAEFDRAEFDQAEFDRAELDRAVLTAVDELAGDCDLSDRT